MDHFALPHDSLYLAAQQGNLHRNFMGYTVCNTDLLLGLGTSAISDAKYGYMQNAKVVEQYKEQVLTEKLAIFKSHDMSEEDLLIKKYILDLLCKGQFSMDDEIVSSLSREAIAQYMDMEDEGLIVLKNKMLLVTEKGKAFIRNIAMVLDKRLRETKKTAENLFSKAI